MTYYSQWGQDEHLNKYVFRGLTGGVYVDVGAHDGTTYSNTRFFDDTLGWVGICIEPIDTVFQTLVANRPRADCINACAYNRAGEVEFCNITDYSEMLSGVHADYSPEHLARIHKELRDKGGEMEIKVKKAVTLQSVLDERGISFVDYLTIDTEGSERKVLEGIDWARAKIAIIDIENNYSGEQNTNIHQYLLDRGYVYGMTIVGDEIYVRPDLLRTGK